MAIHFELERAGSSFYARANGAQRFFIGRVTHYEGRVGLYNVPASELPKLLYLADEMRPIYGFWADFVEPTAHCEGANFLTLNTYDRARFTWGFGQFGAHVPDGDFVSFFRELLERPEALQYFPDLKLKDGRIVKVGAATSIQLESAQSTNLLLDYLNPTSASVEDAEAVAAAKMIHWTTEDADVRELQCKHMISAFKRIMHEADQRLDLDGQPASICCVVCDIRHQGRSRYHVMQAALATKDPLAALLKIGEAHYLPRIKTLTNRIKSHSQVFSMKKWSRTKGDFV